MRIAIYGTGGAGGYFGAKLAQAGVDITFIARGDHLRAIREGGLRLEGDKGDILIKPARATDDPIQVAPVDVVILGVKTWQVLEAAEAIKPMIGRESCVLPLQNGVEAAAQLGQILGAQHVLIGLCATFSWVVGPGHIRTVGETNFIKFGEQNDKPSERCQRLLNIFQSAGVSAEIPSDVQVALWEKFLLMSHGGVGAVTRAPVGVLRSLPETRTMIEDSMHEVFEIAKASKVSLSADTVPRTMSFLDSVVPNATTSLYRDIVAGKPSELEAWNGAVVRLGRKTGVPTPLNEFIYNCLLPLELRARSQLQF
jgi:2-dehydropantoate 2-reductase